MDLLTAFFQNPDKAFGCDVFDFVCIVSSRQWLVFRQKDYFFYRYCCHHEISTQKKSGRGMHQKKCGLQLPRPLFHYNHWKRGVARRLQPHAPGVQQGEDSLTSLVYVNDSFKLGKQSEMSQFLGNSHQREALLQ